MLVPTHREMAAVREALEAAGVPAVVAGARSVFGAPAAREWLALLAAIERPSSIPRVHAAALSPFIGWRVDDVATAGDEAWEHVHVRLHEWATVLRTRGVAALAQTVSHREQLPARLLGDEGGERHLTDIGHIGQLLHREATRARLGVTALTAWLRARIKESADDLDEERSRRLDTDAAAVQVLTIHRCKGLQFPVVYCPYLWLPPWIPKDPLPVFADAADGNRRTIDVGGREHPGYAGHHEQHVAEVRGESLRLAYVALTRSCHQTVVHWATSWDSRESALARILFAGQLSSTDVTLARPPMEAAVIDRAEELAVATAGAVAVGTRRRRRPALGRPPTHLTVARRAPLRPRLRRHVAAGVVQQPHGTGARGARTRPAWPARPTWWPRWTRTATTRPSSAARSPPTATTGRPTMRPPCRWQR